MSRALDKLDAKVTASVKDGTAIKNMTRDQLLDYAVSCSTGIKASLSFFDELEPASVEKLKDKLIELRKANSKDLVVEVENVLLNNLTGIAKARQDRAFQGAVLETARGLVMIIDEIILNIDKLFADKTFNLYNTKISNVAVYGMLGSADTLGKYLECYVAAVLMSMKPDVMTVTPYAKKYVVAHAEEVADFCNRMINGKLNKTFTAGIIRYKKSGNDTAILTSDNQSAAKFAKLGGEVNESDVKSGCKGLYIFKLSAMREQNKARVEFLQMELEGEDPNSERYKKIVKIIKNYNDMIDRLNQKIDKYYNDED